MKPKTLNINELSPHLFWDVDIKNLDVKIAKKFIVERVFTLGSAKEITLVIKYYGSSQVIQVLKELNYMDPKSLNFISKLFKISLPSFKCYTRKQLNPQHWNS